MNPGEWIAISTSAVSLVSIIYFGMFRMAKVESRVEILWHMILSRSLSTAIVHGTMDAQSPLHVPLHVLQTHCQLFLKIREFYESVGFKMNDLELFIALGQRFSKDFNTIVLNDKLPVEALVMAALYECRPKMKLFDDFNNTLEESKNMDQGECK